ncbi:MAG: DegV family protein [Candidatus Heimdallarchaeota archaeon]
MANVKIISDSTFDLPIVLIKKLDISVIPANVIFDSEIISHYDISNEDFYNRLSQGETSTTGVPSPKTFKDVFDDSLDASDDVLVFTLSKKLSGMYSTAKLVVDNFFDERITIIDTESATLQMGLIVYLSALKAKSGHSKQEIIDYANNFLIPNSQLLGIVDSLRYLKRSGRISTIRWLLGSLLSIKPIIRLDDGLITSPGKVRSKEHAIELLQKVAHQVVASKKSDSMIVGHIRNFELAKEFEEYIKAIPNAPNDIILSEVGPVVGTHLGLGAIGYAWIGGFNKDWLE